MSIKILRITTEINRGSIGRTAEQLGNLVIKEGWESYIAFGRTNGKSSSKKIKIGCNLSVYFHIILSRIFDLHGHGSYFSTKKFVKKIELIKPDIIHLHDIHGYYLNLKILFKYLSSKNIPIVWTQHDCWAFTGHCAFFTEIKCEKWKSLCYSCPLFNSYPKSWYMDNSPLNFRLKKRLFTSVNQMYIIAVSDWMRNLLQESFLNCFPTSRIYNGIDTDTFKPSGDNNIIRSKYNIGDRIILIAAATSWGERKGLSDYYKLRDLISNEYVIVLVGTSPKLSSSLPDGIIGISRTDNVSELVDIYSSASILLNLAYEESFGKTTPEGMACGIPSIVYNCTASPELIDNSCGIVVEKGDIIGVSRAISTIMTWDKEKTKSYCINRVNELFDMNKNFNQYINLYKSILNNKQKEPIIHTE